MSRDDFITLLIMYDEWRDDTIAGAEFAIQMGDYRTAKEMTEQRQEVTRVMVRLGRESGITIGMSEVMH